MRSGSPSVHQTGSRPRARSCLHQLGGAHSSSWRNHRRIDINSSTRCCLVPSSGAGSRLPKRAADCESVSLDTEQHACGPDPFKTLKNSVAIHVAGSPLYADASSITLAMTRVSAGVSAKATPHAMPMNRAAVATLHRDCLLFVFPSSHRARHAGLCKKRPCSRAQ